MHNVSITIRIPEDQLSIIDNYASEEGLSRSDVFRNLIINAAANIEEQKRKEKLLAASKKVTNSSLKENVSFNYTLTDGLNDE